MAVLPQIQEDKWKSLRYLLGGIFLVLVLIEKSMGFDPKAAGNLFPKQGFRNIGKTQEKTKFAEPTDPFSKETWEDDLNWEEEVLTQTFPDAEPKQKSRTKLVDDTIPEITLPEDRFPGAGKRLQADAGFLPVYFLKFYGTGKNSQSQLVKLSREFPGGDPIPFLFQELTKGPNAEEKGKGVLSALSKKVRMEPNYRLEDGILHISVSEDISYGGSMEILKDRLDQISFTMVGNFGIKGVILYSNGERIRTLGSDGLSIPEILAKSQRKVIIF
ncbi:spore gernimation protein [Leptospira congkakensis]|uniref:Spore gernimation protein n=1 Tax=Leptospira congkakensis TaxID=2484932 RepID=A0A4Z1ALP2_9LEPT|nr:GerMN domain-containing protein [Leptospira congkakensis]TGL90432.1 spore gernimation protein [Leptospira congkakensis]TGL91439.1 spore gernimation protein [Leptospira congkakensis]TGL98491.1 spore gernimation protein [Leptospira congkakensis]